MIYFSWAIFIDLLSLASASSSSLTTVHVQQSTTHKTRNSSKNKYKREQGHNKWSKEIKYKIVQNQSHIQREVIFLCYCCATNSIILYTYLLTMLAVFRSLQELKTASSAHNCAFCSSAKVLSLQGSLDLRSQSQSQVAACHPRSCSACQDKGILRR